MNITRRDSPETFDISKRCQKDPSDESTLIVEHPPHFGLTVCSFLSIVYTCIQRLLERSKPSVVISNLKASSWVGRTFLSSFENFILDIACCWEEGGVLAKARMTFALLVPLGLDRKS